MGQYRKVQGMFRYYGSMLSSGKPKSKFTMTDFHLYPEAYIEILGNKKGKYNLIISELHKTKKIIEDRFKSRLPLRKGKLSYNDTQHIVQLFHSMTNILLIYDFDKSQIPVSVFNMIDIDSLIDELEFMMGIFQTFLKCYKPVMDVMKLDPIKYKDYEVYKSWSNWTTYIRTSHAIIRKLYLMKS